MHSEICCLLNMDSVLASRSFTVQTNKQYDSSEWVLINSIFMWCIKVFEQMQKMLHFYARNKRTEVKLLEFNSNISVLVVRH